MDDKEFHLRLLLTSLAASANPPAAAATDATATSITALHLIQQGNYLQALRIALIDLDIAARCPIQPPESTIEWFDGLQAAAHSIATSVRAWSSEQGRLLALAAVASLYIFTQANLTGPCIDAPESPFDLLELPESSLAGPGAASGAPSEATSREIGRDSMNAADRWACSLLAENGEDLVGRIRFPQYLLFSKLVLQTPISSAKEEGDLSSFPPEWYWWSMRMVLTQQRVLAARSAVLRARLVELRDKVLDAYAYTPPQHAQHDGNLAAAALLEAAMLETAYGHAAEAKTYTDQALAHLELHAELGGALGVRTVHQQDAHAQLILRVSVSSTASTLSSDAVKKTNAVFNSGVDAAVLDTFLMEGSGSHEDVKGLEDESDVLRHPKLVASTNSSGDAEQESYTLPALTPLQQVAILALGVHARKGSSADGLQPWEIFAHADAVLQQTHSEFLVRAAAHLQITRVERQRSRTRERALLGLEGLAQALDRNSNEGDELDVAARMRCAFAVWFPLRISLRKELGEAFVALGLVGAALPLFESLELWDNLIVCYRLLDKKIAAEQLIMRRLEATPDEPRLWCALGDLSLDDAHYFEAWERSGKRNARAVRSLARNAVRHERYAESAAYWETALGLNPLHPEGWFHLGWCYIKKKDYPNAMRALTRSAQMDPDNGEAWNNLAAVHMHMEHWREAYAALTEAVKYNRGSWHTWDNYAGVAAKVGEWQVAVRAVSQVVGLSEGQRLDLGVLGEIICEVERIKRMGGTLATNTGNQGVEEASVAAAAAAAAEIGRGGGAVDSTSNVAIARDAVESDGDTGTAAAAMVESLGTLELTDETMTLKSTLVAEEAAAAERSAGTFLKLAGNLMKQIAGTAAGDSAFWALYARYYKALGESEAATECLLKRVRALQGGSWRENEADFVTYANACSDLCRAYLATGGARELGQARMLLRGTIKQAGERYDEHALYAELQSVMGEVELKTQEQRQAAT